jgi:hypothetical protein
MSRVPRPRRHGAQPAWLLIASLSLAPMRRRYDESHGLCVRHAIRVTAGASAQLTHRHVDARLALLAWEVEETARKHTWAFRHEESGPEQGGWLRGLAQIDGRVLMGGPAPAMPNPDPGVTRDQHV